MRSVKIGLFAINYGTCADPEVAVRVARHAEDAGFESVWTGEHIVLPLSVTPAGPLDLAAVEHHAELGIDRLVLLPQSDADRAQRHAPVPADQILRNIDTVADQIIAKL